MPDLDFSPQRPRQLLAVYPDRATAEAVLDEVQHLPGEEGRVGAAQDYVDSLRGEMHQEISDSYFSPQAAFIVTKEATKSLTIVLPLATLIGALIGLPFAAIEFGGLGVVARLLICAAIGAVGGATCGWIIGAGLGVKGPEEQAAAQRGVTVRVWPDDPRVREVMAKRRPLRLDVVDDAGRPLETITTEEQQQDDGAFERVEHRLPQPPGGDWSPVRDDAERHGRAVEGQAYVTEEQDER
jgi:hypothetical protein